MPCGAGRSRAAVQACISGNRLNRPRAPARRARTARHRAGKRMVEARPLGGEGPELQHQPLRSGRVAAREVALPPGPHHVGERNVHRADLLAAPAKARSVGQVARVVDACELRRQHRAHRPGIDRAVGMAADRAIDRAMIEAGAAADTAQHVGELVAEHLAPSIVEQDDVIGGWTVGIALAARARWRRSCRW